MKDPKENSRFPKACYDNGMTYNEIILSVLYHAMRIYKKNLIPIIVPYSNLKLSAKKQNK